MAEAVLTIYGRGESRQAELNPEGTIIGRSPRCDVVIDNKDVSREHARVFQDPFGRWIFEDLGSSNGMFVNGRRVDACAVLPGEAVVIGPASLSISGPSDHQVEADASVQAANIIVEDFETEIFYGRSKAAVSARPCPERLDEIRERLSQLTSSSALYPEVCRRLAWAPKTVAAVLRVPGRSKPLPKTSEVLACHFGTSADDTAAHVAAGTYPSHLAFRVSHRVLEEVRSSGEAVMAKSIYSSDVEVTVTVVDEHSPRAVICAPLGDAAETVDLLYLDIPLGGGMRVSPEETFAFVRAAAGQVASARKSLTPIHIKAERSTLDHELSLAQQIQSRLAPIVPAGLSGFEAAVRYKPVIWVGGDYCDVWILQDGRLAFAVGHISRRGLSAAMAISELRTLLRTTMFFCGELAGVVKHVSSHLAGSSLEGVSASLLLGVFDKSAGALRYVNAGHTGALVVDPQSGVMPLGETGGDMLGGGKANFRENLQAMGGGAALVVFTEGVTKARSPEGDEFGEKRLMHVLKDACGRSAEKIADSIAKAVSDFRKSLAQRDDNTTFVLVNSVRPG
jgi:serine phosphatase RsbU (regulator of sigma subunit)